jgi:transposase
MHQDRDEGASYRRVEVITGRRRRRFWSDDEKARIVSESADPEANVTEVARRNEVSRGLLSVWRRQARFSSIGAASFARVQIENSSDSRVTTVKCGSGSVADDSRIEIRIGGATVHVPAGADAETLIHVLAALRFER